jgi:hypothetical protein
LALGFGIKLWHWGCAIGLWDWALVGFRIELDRSAELWTCAFGGALGLRTDLCASALKLALDCGFERILDVDLGLSFGPCR